MAVVTQTKDLDNCSTIQNYSFSRVKNHNI